MIRILYFASLRERLGRDREALDIPPEVETLGDLAGWLASRGGPWAEAFAGPEAPMMALDQEAADPAVPLHEGAEVAFFPPVTGG